jgi:hypothetical protein
MTDARDRLVDLIKSASSEDQNRTKLTRETLFRLLSDYPDARSGGRILQLFTTSHDAMEAAIVMGEAAKIEEAREQCLRLVLDSFPPELH